MSVEGINAGVTAATRAARLDRPARAFDQLSIGDTLQLRVLERLGARDYVVAFGGERHRVESAVVLEVGADVRVGVVAIGERLVLRRLDVQAHGEAAESGDLLGQLARRYGVQLAANDREPLLAAAAGAADPTRMLLSGLYLAKLGMAPEHEAAAAVYEAQRDASADEARERPIAVDGSGIDSTDVVLEWLSDAFEARGAQADAGDSGTGGDTDRSDELARWALNLQDDGSVQYRYATLPLVIGGELRELQVALFTPREPTARDSDVRRLVMTLETPQLKQVRIEAKSVGERLAVAIDVAAPHGVEALVEREGEVRELLARLGWSVEALSYGINVPPDRAARRIVEHVLTAGTVDAVF
jgi:hypothetical protein